MKIEFEENIEMIRRESIEAIDYLSKDLLMKMENKKPSQDEREEIEMIKKDIFFYEVRLDTLADICAIGSTSGVGLGMPNE